MNITINLVATELAASINNLAASLQTLGALDKAAKPRKGKEPAPAEEAPPLAPAPAPVEEAPGITTYEALRVFVAPLLADPATKSAVAKIVKKYCDGKLQNIKAEDYPELVASLKGLAK